MGTELSQAFPAKTGHTCTDCEEAIVYTEEAFLIEVVQPQVIGGQVFLHPIIDENDPDGDFLFQPYFFCFKDWEAHYEELREQTEDEPPVPDTLSVLECACCSSGIREWEYTGKFTLGEFHISRRSPNKVPEPKFQPNGKPDLLCLYCLSVINDNYIVMWDDLSQFGECIDCVRTRCWRHSPCGCGCHLPDPDFNDNA